MTLLDITFINQIFAGVLTFLAIGLLRFFYIVNDAIKMVIKVYVLTIKDKPQ